MAKYVDLKNLANDLNNTKKIINIKYNITEDEDPRIEDELYIEDVKDYIDKIDALNTKMADATPQYILKDKTLYVNKEKITGELEYYTHNPILPGKEDKIAVPAGKYIKERITVLGDKNLIPANIKFGISLFGVSGTYSNSAGIELNTTNVTSDDVVKNKTIFTYNKTTNTKEVITGNVENYRNQQFTCQVNDYVDNDEFILDIPMTGIYDSSSYCILTKNAIKNYVGNIDPAIIREGVTILDVIGTAKASEEEEEE